MRIDSDLARKDHDKMALLLENQKMQDLREENACLHGLVDTLTKEISELVEDYSELLGKLRNERKARKGEGAPVPSEKHAKKFWMVTRKPMKGEKTHTFTRFRHYSLASARREAQRIATQESRPFVVLEVIERFDPQLEGAS